MRVLLISPLPPPVGGIATWTNNVINYFKNGSHGEVDLLYVNTSIGRFSITSSSRFARVVRGLYVTLKIYLQLLKKLICNKPDLIHLTSSGSIALFKDLLIIVTCKIFNTQTVVHFRYGRIPEVLLTKSIESFLIKLVARFSDRVIVLDLKSHLSLKANKIDNSLVVGNPIPADFESKVQSLNNKRLVQTSKKIVDESDKGSRIKHVIFVGHIKPAKGIYELVKAMKSTSSACQIDFVGPYENSTRKQLLTIARELNVSLVFHGAKDRDYIFSMLGASDVLALPSYTEGFPNVILEALVVGCPVVSTSVGAIPDIISENLKTGLVVKPRDVCELREAITKLLFDDKLREEFAKTGQEHVLKHYSTNIIYQKYVDLWHQLIKV